MEPAASDFELHRKVWAPAGRKVPAFCPVCATLLITRTVILRRQAVGCPESPPRATAKVGSCGRGDARRLPQWCGTRH